MMHPYPWQAGVWQTLMARLDRLPHALLFTGQRGTGKTDFALLLAQSLLCEAPTADHLPCGACAACHWFASGAHPDFRIVAPQADEDGGASASAPIKIDQIREVADFITLTSHQKGRRILLVQSAENMNANAANALLKTLEEPPGEALLLLVAHRAGLLPATILSRCLKVRMPNPAETQAAEWLAGQGVADAGTLAAYAGNAPLAARQEAGQPEMVRQRREVLAQLLAPGKLDPLALAASLEKLDRRMVVEWLLKAVHDLLASRLAGQTRFYPELAGQIEAVAWATALDALRDLHALIIECAATAAHPLNSQLFYERLLMAWQETVGAAKETA